MTDGVFERSIDGGSVTFRAARPLTAAEERHQRYLQQFPEKRRLRQERQREAWKLRTPEWYRVKTDPTYGKPPAQLPPVEPPQPQTHPTPELDEFQKKAVAEQQALWSYIKQNTVTTETLCTDPEPSTGTIEDEDM